ncbi:MAG TPA: diacylglycerol kinase family protein [Chthonomonadales bacterium]|nr:diacylglycerol kinase family protein [Chthonomonadales bacterium]
MGPSGEVRGVAWIVANPVAGRGWQEWSPERLAEELRRHGFDARIHRTRAPGDGALAARQAAKSGACVVAAAGGDGTVREVAEGLLGSDAPLAILPCGTANVLAHDLGIPMDPVRACSIAAGGVVRAVDAAWCGESLWMLACGAGLDAAITLGVRREWKRRVGMAAYTPSILRSVLSMRPFRAEVCVDGVAFPETLWLALAANTRHYAGRFCLGADVRIDDGLLHLFLFTGGRMALVRALLALAAGRLDRCASVRVVRGAAIDVRAEPDQPVQIDGDTRLQTPVSIRVAPGAVRVRVPSSWAQTGTDATKMRGTPSR